MSGWFCSNGLGPGPSGGTGDTRPNGLAGPTSRIRKKTLMSISTAPVYGTSVPSRARFRYTTSADSDASTKIQKRIDPSSAPHILHAEVVRHEGVHHGQGGHGRQAPHRVHRHHPAAQQVGPALPRPDQ